MIHRRPNQQRGQSKTSWLDSRHTFSFGSYHDPEQMGFGALRVINEDRVTPGAGFPTHGHRDMEIITYVLDGALAHRDSIGTSSVIPAGDVQRMSAGTGISHSEFNDSKTAPVHFLQIWLLPNRSAIEPGYEQRAFSAEDKSGKWQLIASPDGAQNSLTVHQDVKVYLANIVNGASLEFAGDPRRKYWIQIVRGAIKLRGEKMAAGDGAAITDETILDFIAVQPSEVMLFDLA
jgi:redox-sensitive bicupin YhaK (pirin superfamily)